MRPALPFRRDEQGSSAVEFALVVPLFLALVFGLINLSIVLFGVVTMHYAAEDAARCYSVQSTVCTTPGTTQTYAVSRYAGPNFPPAFIATKDGRCHSTAGAFDGKKVTATASYGFGTGLVNVTLPLSAEGCFP